MGAAGSISQTFDRAGNITSDGRSLTGIAGDAGTNTQTFTYDALRRLTGSTGLAVGDTTNQYDLDGNRTRRVEGAVTTDFSYDRADQVVSQTIGVTSRTFDYDRYGNLLTSADKASATTTYAYDEASRLKTISPPGGAANQITFTLDALDRQATRAVNGVTTDTYAFADATEVAWQSGQGSPTTSLLDADGTRLAVKTGSTVRWLVFDLHGSVVAMCPAGTSSLSDAYRFDGFGQQVDSAGSATNPWRYRGLLNATNDFGSGALLDMAARHYSPQLGQFSQQDSVQGSAANPFSMNRFLYAHANPATLVDPDGHRALEDDCSKCYAVARASSTPKADRSSNDSIRAPGIRDGWRDDVAAGRVPTSKDLDRYLRAYAADKCGRSRGCYQEVLTGHRVDPLFGLQVIVATAGVTIACVLICIPIAEGAVAAAGATSVGTAATTFCVYACNSVRDLVGVGCGLAGACVGPELAPLAPPIRAYRGTLNFMDEFGGAMDGPRPGSYPKYTSTDPDAAIGAIEHHLDGAAPNVYRWGEREMDPGIVGAEFSEAVWREMHEANHFTTQGYGGWGVAPGSTETLVNTYYGSVVWDAHVTYGWQLPGGRR